MLVPVWNESFTLPNRPLTEPCIPIVDVRGRPSLVRNPPSDLCSTWKYTGYMSPSCAILWRLISYNSYVETPPNTWTPPGFTYDDNVYRTYNMTTGGLVSAWNIGWNYHSGCGP